MVTGKDSAIQRGMLVVLDLLAFFLAANLAFDLRYYVDWGELQRLFRDSPPPWRALYQAIPYLLLGWTILFAVFGAYRSHLSFREESARVVKAAASAFVIMFAVGFFYRGFSYSRGAAIFLIPISIGLELALRAGFRVLKRRLVQHPMLLESLIIVGSSEESEGVVRRLWMPESPFRPKGILCHPQSPYPRGLARLGAPSELGRFLTREEFDRVLFLSGGLSREELLEAIETCSRHRVPWAVVPFLYDLLQDRLRLNDWIGIPILEPSGSAIVGMNWVVKRAVDWLFAFTLVVLISPLLLVLALLIKLSSPGPVLYVQKRVGLNERPFDLYKFRSMRPENRDRIHRQAMAKVIAEGRPADGSGEKPLYKLANDPRITPIGRWLRRFSLDELPQLFNVLKGDMSLIGPRPAVPYEVAMYDDRHRRRLEAPPGITGLWQVSGRNRLSFEQMIDLDIQYLENWSLGLDLRIAAKTVWAVLFSRGY